MSDYLKNLILLTENIVFIYDVFSIRNSDLKEKKTLKQSQLKKHYIQ
jgi:hypothetical protein